MAALTKDKKMTQRDGKDFSFTLASGATGFRGSIVVLASGLANKGTAAVGLTPVGVAKAAFNQAGGDTTVAVETGIFLFANHGTRTCVAADIGTDAYIEDDQTVGNDSATNTLSVAGKIVDVTSDGVYVRVGV